MRNFLFVIWLLVQLFGYMNAAPKPKRIERSSVKKLLLESGGRFNIGLREDYLLQDCGGPGFKQSFPDIDYSLFGYNVLRGYPLADGHDPGFTLPIFVADYTDLKHTADCRYSLPNGLVVVPDVSCDISFTSHVTETSYQFQSALSASAKVSGGGWGASFSASAAYSKANSELSSKQTIYIISTASCTNYFSKLIPGASPDLDPFFRHWIETLRGTDDENVYFQFFDTFGTHFPTMVTYGAKFSQENKMTSQTYEKKKAEGVNVAVEASYSGLFSIGGGFGLDSSQRQQASDFQKSVETKTVTVGASPPSNGDAMTWASNVKNSPVPVRYKLKSMENIFDYLKPNTVTNVQKVIDNIKKYKDAYCYHLVKKGEPNTCKSFKPGLELKGTRLLSHITYVSSTTFSECVDHCLAENKCLAMTFCVDCKEGGPDYRTCFLYGNFDGKVTYARHMKGWWSYIILDKIKSSYELLSTSIVGNTMFAEAGYSKALCQKKCEENIHCLAFSQNDKSGVCSMYEESEIEGFEVNYDASTVFVV